MSTIENPMPGAGHDIRTLRQDEVDTIAGAGMLSTALDNVVKSIGEALSTAARKG
ncbi:MAG: hypothetical protein ACJ8E5_13070 [Xanthobacteraceae bacterium]|jgi:predicted small secreted protein